MHFIFLSSKNIRLKTSCDDIKCQLPIIICITKQGSYELSFSNLAKMYTCERINYRVDEFRCT